MSSSRRSSRKRLKRSTVSVAFFSSQPDETTASVEMVSIRISAAALTSLRRRRSAGSSRIVAASSFAASRAFFCSGSGASFGTRTASASGSMASSRRAARPGRSTPPDALMIAARSFSPMRRSSAASRAASVAKASSSRRPAAISSTSRSKETARSRSNGCDTVLRSPTRPLHRSIRIASWPRHRVSPRAAFRPEWFARHVPSSARNRAPI